MPALLHRRKHFRAAPDDAVLHYNCDEGSGTTLLDSGSGGNNATHNADYEAGKVGPYSLKFNGSSDYAVTASNNVGCSYSAISICYWLYLPVWANGMIPAHKEPTANGSIFQLFTWADVMHNTLYGVSSAVADTYFTKAQIGLGAFQHIALIWDKTVDSGNVKMFVNAAEVSYVGGQQRALTVNLRADSGAMHLGAHKGTQYWLNGRLDDFRIYNYAIGSAKLAQLVAMGA